MSPSTTLPAQGAIVIPFPRYKQSPPRRARRPREASPDFEAGFELAMFLMRNITGFGK